MTKCEGQVGRAIRKRVGEVSGWGGNRRHWETEVRHSPEAGEGQPLQRKQHQALRDRDAGARHRRSAGVPGQWLGP